MGHHSVVSGQLKSTGILRVDGLSTGPPDLGCHIQDLRLFNNWLTNEIPTSIWKIPSLEIFLVYNNNLLTIDSLESYLKVLGSTIVWCSWILQIISLVVKSCKVFALVND